MVKSSKRGCCGPTKIPSPLRYSADSAVDLTPAQLAFSGVMQLYLSHRRKTNCTCGEILDVAIGLGYIAPHKDFAFCTKQFTNALHQYKKKEQRPWPTWSEVLGVLLALGWRQLGDATPPVLSLEEKLRRLMKLYMDRRITRSNAQASVSAVREALDLLPTISDQAWLLIPEQIRCAMLAVLVQTIFHGAEES
jgi:hypothetical protein